MTLKVNFPLPGPFIPPTLLKFLKSSLRLGENSILTEKGVCDPSVCELHGRLQHIPSDRYDRKDVG